MVFLQAGMKFSSKIFAVNLVFSKYIVFVFLARLQKYPTVICYLYKNDVRTIYKEN